MTDRHPPINEQFPYFWHGGDYNPDQWLDRPDVLAEDLRLMKLAGCNSMSVGIFAWAALEPHEGELHFDWLDERMDALHAAGVHVVLATPSGAKPNWMAAKYPEIRRVGRDGLRQPQHRRHNHCYTSPVYRQKVAEMDERLAQRYAGHPALAMWHLSNEYSGECYCNLCMAAFRDWLKDRYGTLDALNDAWWSRFWASTLTDWDQLLSMSIDASVDCMALDWRRFVTDQTVDFMRNELAAIRKHSDAPATTNFMGTFKPLNYWKFAPHLDVISDDCYPSYHDRANTPATAGRVSFLHDMCRAMKRKPFMIMESSPSATNWMPVHKLKRPGVHKLQALQHVAHGADTVKYFQWRKGRGSHEKFHGAVVDHVGHENTRVFQDVAEVGKVLSQIQPVLGAGTQADVALIHDWEVRWALDTSCGPSAGEGGSHEKGYTDRCVAHYLPFWKRGVQVDVVHAEADLAGYKLVVAPMLYMLAPGVAERIETFVRNGGTFVATYLTGWVDQANRCFMGGWPGPLKDVLGIWTEEIDGLYGDEGNTVVPADGSDAGLRGEYNAFDYCERVHAETARVLATFGKQFYAGMPAVTVNELGEGKAYYLASRNDDRLLADLYGHLASELDLTRALPVELPEGVTAQVRQADGQRFVFLLNFTNETRTLDLGSAALEDLVDGQTVSGTVTLGPYGALVGRQSE